MALPPYSPDFNPDEAIWDWAREEVTANICFCTAAKAREQIDRFFAGLTQRTTEVQQRCRKELQAKADADGSGQSAVRPDTACRSHLGISLGQAYTHLRISAKRTRRPGQETQSACGESCEEKVFFIAGDDVVLGESNGGLPMA